ncbi:hypothetical protein HDZ31DRAFT_83892 [Schizophyllum fasciatum]
MPRTFIETAQSFADSTGATFGIDSRLAGVEAGPARLVLVGRAGSVHASMLRDVEVAVRDGAGATLARHRLRPGEAFMRVNVAAVKGPVVIGVWRTTGEVNEMVTISGSKHRREIRSTPGAKGTLEDATRVQRVKGGAQVLHTLLATITASVQAMMALPEHSWDAGLYAEQDAMSGRSRMDACALPLV